MFSKQQQNEIRHSAMMAKEVLMTAISCDGQNITHVYYVLPIGVCCEVLRQTQ